MCLTFHIRVVHVFGMLKKKTIYTKYTAVQTDLKYPLRRHAKKRLNTEYMK